MIPVRNISIELGMYNSHLGLIIFHIAFQTGFCTFFLRNFIKELPFELIEVCKELTEQLNGLFIEKL